MQHHDSRPTVRVPPPPPKTSVQIMQEIDEAYAQMLSLERRMFDLRMQYHTAVVEGR